MTPTLAPSKTGIATGLEPCFSSLLLTFAANSTGAPRVNLLAIVTALLVILVYEASVGNVYKKWYLTLLKNSFVFNLGTLAVGTFFINLSGGNQAVLVYTSVGVAFC